MGTYLQPVDVPVEIIPDEQSQTVLIVGKKGSWRFIDGRVVHFKGLPTCFMIYHVYPNGVTLISSDTSVPRFFSWKKLFSPPNIFLDAANYTGWMEIR